VRQSSSSRRARCSGPCQEAQTPAVPVVIATHGDLNLAALAARAVRWGVRMHGTRRGEAGERAGGYVVTPAKSEPGS